MGSGRIIAIVLAGAAYAFRKRTRVADRVKAYRGIGEWDYRAKAAQPQPNVTRQLGTLVTRALGQQPGIRRQLGTLVAGSVGRQIRRRLTGR